VIVKKTYLFDQKRGEARESWGQKKETRPMSQDRRKKKMILVDTLGERKKSAVRGGRWKGKELETGSGRPKKVVFGKGTGTNLRGLSSRACGPGWREATGQSAWGKSYDPEGIPMRGT